MRTVEGSCYEEGSLGSSGVQSINQRLCILIRAIVESEGEHTRLAALGDDLTSCWTCPLEVFEGARNWHSRDASGKK